MKKPSTAPRRRRTFWIAFVVVNCILSSYFIDTIPSPNPTSRVLPVLTLYDRGTYVIDGYDHYTSDKSLIGGHFYSDKAPLTTWIVLPFYAAVRQFRDLPSGDPLEGFPIVLLLGSLLCGSVPFVLLLLVVGRRLERRDPTLNPVFLVMLPAYGSFLFVYSGVYMSHLLAGILLLASYILLTTRRAPFLCGLLLGLAVLAEFPTALAVPIWIVFIWKQNRRSVIPFLAGGVPALAALAAYNRAITGSLFDLPYAHEADQTFAAMRTWYGMRAPQASALWELLFTRYRGVFFYAPALAVLAATFVVSRGIRGAARAVISTPLGILTVAYLALISSYFTWWGGWSYGPRHFIPITMIWLYEGLVAQLSRRWKAAVYGFSLCGVVMAWMAKATTAHLLEDQYRDPIFESVWPRLRDGGFRPDAIAIPLFHVSDATGAWLWPVLMLVGLGGLYWLHPRLTATMPIKPAAK